MNAPPFGWTAPRGPGRACRERVAGEVARFCSEVLLGLSRPHKTLPC